MQDFEGLGELQGRQQRLYPRPLVQNVGQQLAALGQVRRVQLLPLLEALHVLGQAPHKQVARLLRQTKVICGLRHG